MQRKTLIITLDFPPEYGGIQNVLYMLAKTAGIDTVTPGYKGDRDFDSKQNFKIYRIPCITSNKKTSIPFMFIKTILINPDLLICGHIFTAIIGVLTFKPYIIYTYGMEVFTAKKKLFFRWLMKKSYKIITISDFTSNYLKNSGIPSKKIIKIYPSIDTQKFNPKIDPSYIIERYNLRDRKIILTVGRMAKNERYKGHDTIISILPEIIKKVPDIVWVVVGTGDDSERIKNDVSVCGLSNYVIFTDKVAQNDLLALYKASNVFVMPSDEKTDKGGIKAEGFGIVYAEANACGVPVIAYRAGGAKEAVKNGITGILVEKGNIKELTNMIIKLLLEPDLAKDMGMQGYKRVLKELDMSLFIENFKNIIKNPSI